MTTSFTVTGETLIRDASLLPGNDDWVVDDVIAQYSDANAHSDLYRYIHQWTDMELYLNVGYSRWWNVHMHVSNHHRLIDRLARPLLRAHRQSPWKEEKELLDVASGRGGAAIRACEEFGLSVTGVDITSNNINQAAQNAKARGLSDRVRFRFGDAHHLPFADDTFSLAWSIESPAHFADKRRFLKELCRVVKPGGAIAVCDLLAVGPVAKAHPEVYADFLNVWDVPYLETLDGYREAIQDAGFRLVDDEVVTRHGLNIYRKYCRIFLTLSKIDWLYRRHQRSMLLKTGANLDNVRDHTLYSYNALKLGMIDYGLFWAVKE